MEHAHPYSILKWALEQEPRPTQIAFAESCTGGRLAADFTAFPGSSRVICGSLVAYQTRVKQQVLGLKGVTEDNVVSAETAKQMARAALDLFQADVALSTTGYLDTEHPLAFVGLAIRGEPGLILLAEAVLEDPVDGLIRMPRPNPRDRALNREVVIDAAFDLLASFASPKTPPKTLSNSL